MSKYTFDQKFAANTIKGDTYVYIPDQVADDQKAYDGKSFPVIRRNGGKARATLRGDLYGLWTPGTGAAVVSMS